MLHTLLVRKPRHAVRQAALQQALDHREQPSNRLDHPHIMIRRQHIQSRHIGAEQLRLVFCKLLPVYVRGGCALQQRVVHIRNVLHVGHLNPGVPPGAVKQVKSHIGGCVPHMRGIVRGDTAHVQSRFLWFLELNHGICGGIKDTR